VARAKELAGKPEELILLPSVAAHPAVIELKSAVAEKESEIAVLQQTYKPKHPKYAATLSQLAKLEEQIDKVVLSAAGLVEASFRTAQETEAQFAQAVHEQEKRALELNRIAIQYNVLAREMESNRALYESVLSRMKEMDVSKQLDQTPVKVVEPAYAYGPIRPNVRQIILRGAFAGLVFGVGVAFGLSRLDTSLKTVDQAEQLLGLPVFSAVPKTKSVVTHGDQGSTLPAVNDAKGNVAEAFRSLRSKLSLLGREEARRTVLFTSAVPAEGKSFTCSNYAVACAQAGFSTLLIDADLRKPTISRAFFGEVRTPGLTDCLVAHASLEQATHQTNVDRLSVLPAGTPAPNPAELLVSAEFSKLLTRALETHDRVIIDTAPVNAVGDALMLAPHVQTVCLVVRADSTPRAAVQRAIKTLSDIRCSPAGMILNQVPQHHGIGYYYYYSAGEYGSEGVYGAKAC
jgi:capsular exopolysaccharide synthesis family protein